MADHSLPTRVGDVIASKYRLERLLGSGGMGSVYAARHQFTDRVVALKLMHDNFARSPVFVERFVREARAPSSINHPGIVQVLDGGTDVDGTPYLVLEMLQGKTLDDLPAPLSVPDLIDVIGQLLDALDAAHRAGFVHRDIKPENVFLTHDAHGKRTLKLLDFGVAGLRSENVNLTQTGTILGTPTFMSPEQARGERVDQRSDLWAVGAILYDCLAGRPPYEAETYNAVIVSIATREHVPLETLRPDLPRPLLLVIERALRKDVSQRWQSASEMAAALRALEGLDAISGVITKHTPPDAVAATQVARPRAQGAQPVKPVPQAQAGMPGEVAAANHAPAPTRASKPEPRAAAAESNGPSAVSARRGLPTAPDAQAASTSSNATVVWVGSAALVILLSLGAVWWATRRRSDAHALAATPTAVAGTPAETTPPETTVPVANAAVPSPTTTPTSEPPAAVGAAAVVVEAPEDQPGAAPVAAEPVVAPNEARVPPLNADDLSAVVTQRESKLEACYQDLLVKEMLAGTGAASKPLSLRVTLSVSAQGHVRTVDVAGAAPAELASCMRSQLSSATFRPTAQDSELTFPIVFQPSVIQR